MPSSIVESTLLLLAKNRSDIHCTCRKLLQKLFLLMSLSLIAASLHTTSMIYLLFSRSGIDYLMPAT